jgi:hypothetical protein
MNQTAAAMPASTAPAKNHTLFGLILAELYMRNEVPTANIAASRESPPTRENARAGMLARKTDTKLMTKHATVEAGSHAMTLFQKNA